MKFEQAMDGLRSGQKFRRRCWNSHALWIVLIPGGATLVPQKFAGGYPVEQYLMLHTLNDTLVPFVISTGDVMGDDWELAGGPPATSMTRLPHKEQTQ